MKPGDEVRVKGRSKKVELVHPIPRIPCEGSSIRGWCVLDFDGRHRFFRMEDLKP